jgi:predicted dehydrogenase
MDKLRVVQAGCGVISPAWLGPVTGRSDVEIVGLVDIDRNAAETRAREHGLADAEIGTDLESVLARTKPDAVFDCTVPEAHRRVTTTALRHGCHVLGEKPMADTMANAHAMVAAARETGRTYAVMQNRRYLPAMVALRRFLDGGTLGRITTVHGDYFMAPHFGGFRDRMPHPLLLDMAIHTFDQARFLVRQDALAAQAHEWNPPGSWYDGAASAVAVFEMTNQVVFCYRGSWVSEGLATPWESAWRIVGDRGSVAWDGGDTFRAQVAAEGTGMLRGARDVQIGPGGAVLPYTGHAGCIDEFVRSVIAGTTPQTVCTDNIRSLAMVHGAIAAAEQGQRVACECAPTG